MDIRARVRPTIAPYPRSPLKIPDFSYASRPVKKARPTFYRVIHIPARTRQIGTMFYCPPAIPMFTFPHSYVFLLLAILRFDFMIVTPPRILRAVVRPMSGRRVIFFLRHPLFFASRDVPTTRVYVRRNRNVRRFRHAYKDIYLSQRTL